MNTEQIINYLESAQKQFEYYKLLGEKTMAQLSDEELFWQANESSNSVAIIGKHLWGNMRSRWSDFLTSDGEKEWRNRDAEFEADIKNREELMQKWEEGWQTVFEALASITVDNFDTTVYIRNMGHTITEAVNRQMAHYAYHIGQLVFLGKLLKGKQWQSLSIAKGKSQVYNQEKFAKPKHREHFTQAFLKEKGK
ncbi:DUF1572 family protein [Microscilla marina]|uniref:Hypothetical conserved protein n=1 Tax=Microscilla marina ATCC 23134 TaxID=313606 RepID=A1ZXA4_MICM2|nr:DUF1572 family protein [Microscilla marina]EAY24978.1 hypothetical conserved protein [Microscilla marina ATCC 23134]